MNELLDWVSNQGFAIAIATFLMLRIDSKLDRLLKVVENWK